MASIYVGNLPYTATEEEIGAVFAPFGTVQSVKIIMDRETGRPRGFGFVDMDREEAKAAIKEVNGSEMGGRTLRVNEAHDRPPARPSPDRY
ncbi:MAG: RNA recognition motif domain-containing protein [Gammaproteobacteria bacterium]